MSYRLRKPFEKLSMPTATPVVHANHAELVAWIVMNVWQSHLGLPLLISTILLSKRINRHATFINMCITWMIVGFSSSLLCVAAKDLYESCFLNRLQTLCRIPDWP